jgi:hypothetical protein
VGLRARAGPPAARGQHEAARNEGGQGQDNASHECFSIGGRTNRSNRMPSDRTDRLLIENNVGTVRNNTSHFARAVIDEEGAAVDLVQNGRRARTTAT